MLKEPLNDMNKLCQYISEETNVSFVEVLKKIPSILKKIDGTTSLIFREYYLCNSNIETIRRDNPDITISKIKKNLISGTEEIIRRLEEDKND